MRREKYNLQHKILLLMLEYKEMSMKSNFTPWLCTITPKGIESVTRNNDLMWLFLFFEQTRK